jgi:hypothetical protein
VEKKSSNAGGAKESKGAKDIEPQRDLKIIKIFAALC